MIKTEELIDRVLKLDAEATKAGCLPADNCIFDVASWRCVVCGRESGKNVDMYREEWNAVNHQRTAAPILAKMLRLSVNYLKACASEKLEGNKYQSELTLADLDRIVAEGLGEG